MVEHSYVAACQEAGEGGLSAEDHQMEADVGAEVHLPPSYVAVGH